MSQRDFFYDNVKGLLIIAVVFCHLLGRCLTKDDVFTRALIIFIYYFHMPLFIFVSGFFSKKVDKCRDGAFRDLFLVFVVAQIFWIIFKFIAEDSTYYLRHFLDPGYAIWYIVALFFWRLLLKDLVKIPHILIIAFLISPLVMFLSDAEMILALNKTVGFLFFFLLGHYATADHVAKVRKIPRPAALIALAAIFGGTYFALFKGWITYGGAKSLLLHTFPIAKADAVWQGIGLYYIAIVIAVVCSIFVLAAVPGKKNFLAYIGGDTLPLYLSHTYFIVLCDLLFAAVALPAAAKYIIVLLLSTLVVAACSTPLYRRLFHGVYNFLIGKIYPTKGSTS